MAAVVNFGAHDVRSLSRYTCEDACVYFKCIGPDFKIIEGAGCYGDFASRCLYVKTEVKNQVVKNIKKFEYFDQTVMVVTCSDKDQCAKDAFASMMLKNAHAVVNFGTGLETLASYLIKPVDESCSADSNRQFLPKVECSTRGWCQSGKNYKELYTGRDVAVVDIKTCDACVYYQCTGDGGNKIMGGFGCYEDFENICSGVVPYDVRESIKNNLKHSFHFDKNYLVATCSSDIDCSTEQYLQYNNYH
uniref:Sodefrin-like factor n=1 Tax=Panagrolaimus superbus TaxID=310955 RepID=A0A914Z852_9BILA